MEGHLDGGKIIVKEGEMSKVKIQLQRKKLLNNEKICKNYRNWKLPAK